MKKIYLGRDKKLAGVCDGIAKSLNIDPTFIRIIFVSLALMTAVVPVLTAYVVGALIFGVFAVLVLLVDATRDRILNFEEKADIFASVLWF